MLGSTRGSHGHLPFGCTPRTCAACRPHIWTAVRPSGPCRNLPGFAAMRYSTECVPCLPVFCSQQGSGVAACGAKSLQLQRKKGVARNPLALRNERVGQSRGASRAARCEAKLALDGQGAARFLARGIVTVWRRRR